MIDLGINSKAFDCFGLTALMRLALIQMEDDRAVCIAKILVEEGGADPTLVCKNKHSTRRGKTAVELALNRRGKKNPGLCEYLCEAEKRGK